MIDILKSYGSFIENIINPVLDKASDLIWYIEQKGIPVETVIKEAWKQYFKSLIIRGFIQIGITIIICFTVWKIYR